MAENNPIPYNYARVLVLGEIVAPIRDGHPIAARMCYPIELKDDLILFGGSNEPTDEERRFAGLTREVWHRIPEAERQKIVAFWRGDGRNSVYLEIEWCPQLELRDDWVRRGAANPGMTLEGAVFCFHRQSVVTSDSEYVRTVVAHEFAHALQRANGEWGQQRPIPPMTPAKMEDFLAEQFGCEKHNIGTILFAVQRTPEQMVAYLYSDDEARADAIVRRWGFDPSLLK